ncbi:hypothetical protein Tco_1274851 [Tanacetum coccineum]
MEAINLEYSHTSSIQCQGIISTLRLHGYIGGLIVSCQHILPYQYVCSPLTSVHSEARSWSIPSEDPYEEAARQLLEQAPRSPEYVPDPMELEDHVPVYIPEPEHPEDLVPAEDEAPTPLLPPSFLSPRSRPLSPRALEVEMRDIASAFYHSLHPSETPPLLPIPAPSTSRRADIPEADTPPRKRLLLTTPRPACEVGESSAAAAARQPGPTMAHRVDHSHVDTMETRFRDIERRMMTALEMVNMRVSYQVDVRSRESSEFYTRHHDAQTDRAAVRAEIEVLRRERLAYEQESIQTRQDLARSEAHCRALEARVTVLETEVHRHEWQRQAADDLAVQYIMRTQALEAGARVDTLEDTEKWHQRKGNIRSTPVTPTPNATPTTTVTEAQLQALIGPRVAADWLVAEASRGCSRLEIWTRLKSIFGSLACSHDMDIMASVYSIKAEKTMQRGYRVYNELRMKRHIAYAERQAEKEKKSDDLSKNNQNQPTSK